MTRLLRSSVGRNIALCGLALAFLLSSPAVHAAGDRVQTDNVTARLIASAERVMPGDTGPHRILRSGQSRLQQQRRYDQRYYGPGGLAQGHGVPGKGRSDLAGLREDLHTGIRCLRYRPADRRRNDAEQRRCGTIRGSPSDHSRGVALAVFRGSRGEYDNPGVRGAGTFPGPAVSGAFLRRPVGRDRPCGRTAVEL